jgi:hypothetical protein
MGSQNESTCRGRRGISSWLLPGVLRQIVFETIESRSKVKRWRRNLRPGMRVCQKELIRSAGQRLQPTTLIGNLSCACPTWTPAPARCLRLYPLSRCMGRVREVRLALWSRINQLVEHPTCPSPPGPRGHLHRHN